MSIDKFYPISGSMKQPGLGVMLSLKMKISGHLAAAKQGDLDRESALVNRLGQVRRNFEHQPEWLTEELQEAVTYLRSVGRVVDFKNSNPALWISQRGGRPRW
jgi:hypothetical protein